MVGDAGAHGFPLSLPTLIFLSVSANLKCMFLVKVIMRLLLSTFMLRECDMNGET
jgi:hypothetical protein